jgi:tRNA pseudouridine38-40 synthase
VLAVRVALGVEYDGSRFSGWQVQVGQRTVQGVLEAAIARVADHPVASVCAGRTDAGVHATGQVVHFDTTVWRDPHNWRLGVTRHLPTDVAVVWACPVGDDFDARRSAVTRHYRYVLLNRAVRPGLWQRRSGWYWKPLDEQRMRAAARCLLGEHDFSSFRAAECQAAHARRRLDRVAIGRCGERIIVEVSGNAFLHHMVRNLVGSLLLVGAGAREVDWMQAVLLARDRRLAGPTVEAAGLYLTRVDYPDGMLLGVPQVEQGGWACGCA